MINLLKIRELAKSKKITIRDIADYCGVTEQGLQKMIRENKMKFDVLLKVSEKLGEPVETFVDSSEAQNAVQVKTFDKIRHSNEINFRRVTPGEGLKSLFFQSHVAVRLVTTKARAGFAGAYYADEYLDDLPTVLIETDKEYRGNYLAFEVDGDSMEPEYHRGDVVICREVKRDLWRYKLHIDEWDFVIAHSTKGIMLKQIIDHNVGSGEIICHSLNSEEHPDFKLNLREVAFLYNVVEHRIPGKNRRRFK